MSIHSFLKNKRNKDDGDLERLILDMAEEVVNKKFEGFKSEAVKEVATQLNREIRRLRTDIKKGDRGERGEKGESTVGSPGRDGAEGKPGRDALPPKDGKDGSPDTPLEIVGKLNTLESKLELKVLKGFEKFRRGLEKAAQSKGGKGGGMGNVIHEQFDGDGSTVVFTLENNVAAGGNAVMACRYEGQTQYLGDQFTISGKTLTFTFTPDAGTKVEITYVRT